MATKPTLGSLWTGSDVRPALWLAVGVLLVAGGLMTARSVAAQEPRAVDQQPQAVDQQPQAVDQQPQAVETRTADELQRLVGPIALYPDDLVAIVLPASTYPLQVVQAARFLEQRKTDTSLQPDESWDDSVVALLNYPDIVKLMNDDLDWTWELGEAVLGQNADVLDAIQGFRDRAYAAGNLRSDDRQIVSAQAEEITIAPANPEVIYVPYYEPERVVVYQSTPVYYYYPWAYPVYYYPYPVGYAFHTGFFWGVSTAFVIGWHSHHVHVYHHDYHGHPYHGHRYNDSYYVRNRYWNGDHSDVWQPGYRRNGRPFTRSQEGYVADRHGDAATPGGATSRSSGSPRANGDPRTAPAVGSGQNRSTFTRTAPGTPRETASPGQPRESTAPQRQSSYRFAGNGAQNGATRSTPAERPSTAPVQRPTDRTTGFGVGREGALSLEPNSTGTRPAQSQRQPAATSTYRSASPTVTRPGTPSTSRSSGSPRSTFGGIARAPEQQSAARPPAAVSRNRPAETPHEARAAPPPRSDSGSSSDGSRSSGGASRGSQGGGDSGGASRGSQGGGDRGQHMYRGSSGSRTR